MTTETKPASPLAPSAPTAQDGVPANACCPHHGTQYLDECAACQFARSYLPEVAAPTAQEGRDALSAFVIGCKTYRDALLVVSTDLAQDALEDPIGNASREKDGWYRLGAGAALSVKKALDSDLPGKRSWVPACTHCNGTAIEPSAPEIPIAQPAREAATPQQPVGAQAQERACWCNQEAGDTECPVHGADECGRCGSKWSGIDPCWRFNGRSWEHRCPDVHPQAAHFPAVRAAAPPPSGHQAEIERMLVGERKE